MTTETTKRGRPKKPTEQVKDESLLVRLTAEEKRQFEKAAEATDLSLSEWVRGCLWACSAPANRGVDPTFWMKGKAE